MSFFSLGPRNGYCLVDFWWVWCAQAIRDRDADRAAFWASRLAQFAHKFYPDTREASAPPTPDRP